MGKKKKDTVQFRYYQMPQESYVFAKLGKSWIREYGKGIDYLHFHNFLEIGYCIDGDGQMIFGNEVCDYKKGDITVIPKNYPHTTNSIPGTMSHWEYLFIDEITFLEKMFPESVHSKKKRKIMEYINKDVLFFPEIKYPCLARDIHDLMETMRNKEIFFQEESEGILASLLVKIAKIHAKNESSRLEEDHTVGHASEVVIDAMDYIGRHYHENIYAEELAKHCNVSETHLRRLFSEHMEVGILEYINRVRIQEACELLKKTDYSVSEIAQRCGFSTVSTFNRNFKKLEGENPCSWRKRPENFEQRLLRYSVHSEAGW